MRSKSAFKIANIALLIALEIVLSRFLSISTPIVKISFSFVPLSMLAMLYGPFYAAAGAAIADIIGVALFPLGAYFPGYTLTAALTGLTYGLLLYQKPKSWGRIVLAVLIVGLVLNLGLNTVWIQMTTGKAYMALLVPRIVKSLTMVPIMVLIIRFAWEKLCPLATKFAE
ncbi:folate family ECF transporter S component [Oscillospiraceae bacterium LTW-04]|nr:folate family ECF transporter S component [Oscillospiraceae bacterium MB24-C1]